MSIIGKGISLKKIRALNDKPAYVDVGQVAFGIAHMEPTIGERFEIYGDMGLSTSPVQHCHQIGDELQIETLNSIYILTIMEEL